jgi:polysaccharide pyruvyl transferase WcaK-like protein
MLSELTNTRFLIAAAVVLVLLIGVGLAMVLRRRRSTTAGLRARFGPEYDRAVTTHGSERKAESQLTDRTTRVEGLKLRELDPGERERFVTNWKSVQSRFLDHPGKAVTEADELVTSLLVARGYPTAEFDQRAADISVNHPRLVDEYRSAHAIAVRTVKEEINTEDLRNALIQYRSLFDEFVQPLGPVAVKAVA